jgi:MYXO-CTERM domain-containing protein
MRSLTSITALAALFTGCIDLPPGDMTDPEYWGQVFLDKYATERAYAVEHIEDGPTPLAEPRPVLLITGVTIPAEWFEPIKLRLERDGFMPFVWEPPDLLSGDLLENAHRLADVVEQIRTETGFDRIDILAECTGGVIARYYIQSMGGDQYIKRMVTFISPQHGVDKAPLAASIAGWPALYDLSPGSDWLESVNNAPLPDNVRFTSIYTCTDEYIQPYETSIIPGAHNIGLCDGFVGHYQFFYDPAIYMIMHGALVEAIDGDEGAPADPTDPGIPGDDPNDPSDPGSPVPDDMGGCSAGGGAGGGAGALLLLGAALVATRRRRR